MSMLENAEAKEFEHILVWGEDGSSFTVLNKDLFVQQVIPAYFANLKKWRSFEKQLSNWGFVRREKRHSMTFCHPIFRRGEPESLNRMKYQNSYQARKNTKALVDHSLPNKSEKLSNEGKGKEFPKESIEGHDYNDTESAFSTDDDPETEDVQVPSLTHLTEANHQGCVEKADFAIIAEWDMLQIDQEAIAVDAIPSPDLSDTMDVAETESTKDNHESCLFEGTMGADWLAVGQDLWILSDW